MDAASRIGRTFAGASSSLGGASYYLTLSDILPVRLLSLVVLWSLSLICVCVCVLSANIEIDFELATNQSIRAEYPRQLSKTPS